MDDTAPTVTNARAAARDLSIRGVRLKNRVVAAPMERNYCDLGGRPTQQYVDYLAARAAGGAALLFTESSYVHQLSKARPHQMGMHEDSVLPGLTRMSEEVHAHGSLLGIELNHAGRVVPPAVSQRQPVAPSPIRCIEIDGAMPRALSRAGIEEIVGQFGAAARRAVRGGADVISVHGAHGYLIAQFLSPRTNHRDDEYGAPTRFLNEVLASVRAAIGDEVPMFLRLSAFEGIPGGLDVEKSLDLVAGMDLHLVDVVDLSAGTYGAGHWITPSGEEQEGYLGAIARRYRASTGTLVSVAGRITMPATAERLIASGSADLVSVARAIHADPRWSQHVVDGTDPRPCIACNQGCADVVFSGLPIWCAANPSTGDEGARRLTTSVRDRPTDEWVAVVGAGPAGLEAATSLASRGLRIRLFEARAELGGQFRLAAALRSKPQFDRLLAWYEEELTRLGVDVSRGHRATPDQVAGARAVVLATGGEDYVPPVPGFERERVIGLRTWLAGGALDQPAGSVPEPVTIWGADRAAFFVADELAARGRPVTIVAAQPTLAPDAGAREGLPAHGRLEAAPHVTILLERTVEEILPDGLVVSCSGVRLVVSGSGPVLVSQGSVPAGADPADWVGRAGGPAAVEVATETDGLTFDAALRAGRSAAERVVAALYERLELVTGRVS
jgi:2,4-dienoyl-CoA reductase-like NADH-dependent reductase (Old Yellow Enzyme family)/NADPH-dependent 2,4-dienoyl-CoA reductase/sulfur reductase-like enzyme